MSFIKTDRMDRSIFRGQREINDGIRDLEQRGAERSEAWPPVVQDLWAGMFKAEPEFDKDSAHGPLAKAMSDVMETQEWKNLRQVTKLDEFGSAIGTVSFGKNFLDGLPDEVLKAEEAVNEEQQIQNSMAEAGSSGEYPESFLRELAEQLAKAKSRAKTALAAAEKACDGDITQQVRIAARSAAEAATQETSDAKEFSRAWGSGAGVGTKIPLADQLNLAKKMRENSSMKMFAKMIGRMKRLAEGYQAKKIEKRPEEIVDIETGDDLKSVLPCEFGRLIHKSTSMDFKRRYLEKNLLQYKKIGSDKAGKGPIVIMTDESGSMGGNRIVWAKAVGMGLAYIAQKQKRSLILGGFSSGGQVWTKEFVDGQMSPRDVEEYAAHFFNGGTDFEMALSESMKAIRSSKMPSMQKADLVFISDGDCYISNGFRESFKALKKSMATRIISIGVGCSEESFKDFSDAAFGFGGKLDGDEAALERVFSI